MTLENRRKGKTMKFAGSRLALVATIIATGGVNCARAQDSGSVPAHELQAKLQYCKGCHGSLGQGYRGYSPIPRLAGQQPEYFENQLKAFIERRRLNPIMFNVAHVMSPAMVSGLATHFRDLNPQPVGGGSRNLVPEGKKIYEDGVPGQKFRLARPATVLRPRVKVNFPDLLDSSPSTF